MVEKLYVYIRWSSDRQGEGTTLERQRAGALAFSKQIGLPIEREFVDDGVSAIDGDNQKKGTAFHKFMMMLETGKISTGSYLYVENFDRLSRQSPIIALSLFFKMIGLGCVP